MTINRNKSTKSKVFIMLLISMLLISFMSIPATATTDPAEAGPLLATGTDASANAGQSIEVKIDTENADKATVLVNGQPTESFTVNSGETFKLEVTAAEGYFIRKILLVKAPAEGQKDEEESIVSLEDDKNFSGEIVADRAMTVEIKITSDAFRFFDSFLNFDLNIFGKVQAIRHRFLDAFMMTVTTLGDEGIIFIAIALVFLVTKRYRKIGFAMLISLGVMLVCNNLVLKEIFARERPFNLFATFPEKYSEWNSELGKYVYPELVVKIPHSYSFPSGHTSSAFAAGIAVLCYNRKVGIPVTLFAFLMGFTRIYVGVHYATDVIAGAVVGVIYALIGVLITKYLFPVAEKLLEKIKAKLSKKEKAAE